MKDVKRLYKKYRKKRKKQIKALKYRELQLYKTKILKISIFSEFLSYIKDKTKNKKITNTITRIKNKIEYKIWTSLNQKDYDHILEIKETIYLCSSNF